MSNKPDILVYDSEQKVYQVIDVAIPNCQDIVRKMPDKTTK